MRNRRNVADARYGQTCALQRTDRGLASRARTSNVHFNLAQSEIHRLARSCLRDTLRREGRALPRSLEPNPATGPPGHYVALGIGERNYRVVERRRDEHLAARNELPLPASCSCSVGPGQDDSSARPTSSSRAACRRPSCGRSASCVRSSSSAGRAPEALGGDEAHGKRRCLAAGGCCRSPPA